MNFLISLFFITVMFFKMVESDITKAYMEYFNAQNDKVEKPKKKCTCDSGKTKQGLSARVGIDNCVEITLYTKSNVEGVIISEELTEGFDPDKKTVLLIHGWASTGHHHYVQIARTFAEKKDMNALVVGWHSLAYNCYYAAASATHCIGKYIATVMVQIVDTLGADPDDFHIIGHSLGAHIAGYAGDFFKDMHRERIGRITGLDPAKPYFTVVSFLKALIKGDAEFVVVVHSCIDNVLGTDRVLGDVDIFVNGGSCSSHPQCEGRGLIGTPTCAHYVPVALIEYSINNGPLKMKNCGTNEAYEECTGDESQFSYDQPKDGTAGLYYLKMDASVKLNGLD
ncbi:unnamed protein product [Acanthoscelides obtectus]|uniref:Lipase domain-containing protein n=1 Tax=Acanthoscelides obtectus TaxID=200917 RepID=A0A9P0PRH1_ACAOB|nr:unnamed protein product [Acanthoscelides obtectus]CAK1656783.1 hypothetical protein AOBTE_LOCUS19912 [Acanthoscelides obtectus]